MTWPPGSGLQYILFEYKDGLMLYDLNGKPAFDCDLPGGTHLFRVRAAAFIADRVPYLAIVGSTLSDKRSIFCVYGLPEHRLPGRTVESPLYQEVLDGSYESITKLPHNDSGTESILIGGPGQILRYKPGSLPRDTSKGPRSAPSPGPAKRLKTTN